jgi:AcrR family transcriptional regulator
MTAERMGLRERKKRRTHDTISAVAIGLFLQRGFDGVSVVEIADAAEVSKPTLFKYFPTKEDLVLHRIADHQGEAARVVQGRDPTQTPLTALCRHFLDGLDRRDPITGLCDDPQVLAFHRMVFETPPLAIRISEHTANDEEALARALLGAWDSAPGPASGGGPARTHDPETHPSQSPKSGIRAAGFGTDDREITAQLAAAQIIAVWRVLSRDNWKWLTAGQAAVERYPVAVRRAAAAFTLLGHGLEAGEAATW